MGKLANGAKAGLLAGIVFAAIASIILYFLFLSMKEEIITRIEQGLIATGIPSLPEKLKPESIFDFFLIVSPLFFGLGSMVIGVLIGIIYSYIEPKIPIPNPIVKGIILALIFWFLLGFLPALPSLYQMSGFNFILLLPTLVYGILLGYFYSRFAKKAF
ncbi:MAG: hypothetical protein QXX95_06420 [Nitrososphaerales archaeon]